MPNGQVGGEGEGEGMDITWERRGRVKTLLNYAKEGAKGTRCAKSGHLEFPPTAILAPRL